MATQFLVWQAASPLPSMGIFAGGTYSPSSTVYKYILSTDAVSTISSLNTARWGDTGVSNSTIGLTVGGNDGTSDHTTSTEKFTYSSATFVAGPSLTTGRFMPVGFSNATVGVIGSGSTSGNGGSTVSTTEKYSYAGNSFSSGTGLSAATFGGGGYSSTTIGYAAGGSLGGSYDNDTTGVNQIDKYTYSGDTVTTLSTVFPNRSGISDHGTSAVNNATQAIINTIDAPSDNTKTSKHIYSGDSVTVSTSLSLTYRERFTASTATFGLFAAGRGGGPLHTATEKYTFSSDTSASATSLPSADGYGASMCNSHGGL